jgi:hypothetical protein
MFRSRARKHRVLYKAVNGCTKDCTSITSRSRILVILAGILEWLASLRTPVEEAMDRVTGTYSRLHRADGCLPLAHTNAIADDR